MMNKQSLKTLLLVFVSMIFSLVAFNQTSVEISTNKVSIDGVPFYIHNVKQGQTVYSICKTYNIQENDLIKYNPGIQFGLQINQSLKIPVDSDKTENEPYKTEIAPDYEDTTFIKHIIAPGETLYSISKKYNLSEDTLLAINPYIKDKLRGGTVIRIPRFETASDTSRYLLQIKTDTIYHTVDKKETLFSISKKYNMEISSLILYNRELMWDKLKEGQIIKIPVTDTLIIDTYLEATPDSISPNSIYFKYLTGQLVKNIPLNTGLQKENIKIALLLPFSYERMIELNTYMDTCENKEQLRWAKKKLREVKAKSDFCTDFYIGTLIAIDSLKKTGISVNINVYDTRGDSNIVRYLINKYDLENMDLIIGPFETPCIRTVLEYFGNKTTKIVLPFSSNISEIEKFSNIFQVFPSYKALKELIPYFLAAQSEKNIIMVSNTDSISKTWSEIIIQSANNYLEYYKINTAMAAHKVYYSDTLKRQLLKVFSTDQINLIYISSEDEAVISNTLREISDIKGEYNISILGQPKWLRMVTNNNISTEYLHNLNIICYSPFYIDYNNEKLKKFILRYREQFNSEPFSISSGGINPTFFGYDNTFFFINYLLNPANIDNHLLLGDFNFIQTAPEGGFENISVTFISFENDFSITTTKPPFDILGKP